MSFTELVGFLGEVLEALRGMRAELAKQGVDADVLIARIQGLQDHVVALNEKQESLKRQTMQTTHEVVAVGDEAYEAASGAVNTMSAAVGQNSAKAKNLRELRAKVLRPHQSRKRARKRSPRTAATPPPEQAGSEPPK